MLPGTAGMRPVCPVPVWSLQVPSPSPQSDSQWLSPRTPCGLKSEWGLPPSDPHYGGCWLSPRVLFPQRRNWRLRGHLAPAVHLAGGGAVMPSRSALLSPVQCRCRCRGRSRLTPSSRRLPVVPRPVTTYVTTGVISLQEPL